MQCKFARKTQEAIRAKHAAGSTARSKRKREPKDFEALYEGCLHKSEQGWFGIPAAGFRAACISACRIVSFQMTKAKLSIFIEADGYDAEDGTPLVRITRGEPHPCEHPVRNDDGSLDLRVRAMWDEGWEAIVTVRWDADQFTLTDVANLLARVGMQVGVGEGRPDSRNSAGVGWGTFGIVGQ